MIPTIVRHHAGVVRGGAVRARRAGGARHRAALRRRYRRDLAHLRLARRRFRRARPAPGGAARRGVNSKYRGAQGLDPEFIKSLEKQFGFDKPAYERFFLMLWNYVRFDFGKSYFRDVSVLQLIKEKLPVSISLGIWMTLLTYLISIPLGIRKAVKDGSQFDIWTSGVDHRRLRHPGLPVRHPAHHSVRRRLVLADLSAARPDLGRLVAASLVAKILDYFWHSTLPIISMALAAFATMTLLTKNSFLDEIRKQYVLTARAKGCSRAPGALRPCFPQRHADRDRRLSRRLRRRLLRRLAADRDDLLARRARPARASKACSTATIRWCSPTLYIFSLVGLVVNLISDLTYTWIDPRIDFETREV